MSAFITHFLCFLGGIVTATASIIVLSACAMHASDGDTTDHFTNPEN